MRKEHKPKKEISSVINNVQENSRDNQWLTTAIHQ